MSLKAKQSLVYATDENAPRHCQSLVPLSITKWTEHSLESPTLRSFKFLRFELKMSLYLLQCLVPDHNIIHKQNTLMHKSRKYVSLILRSLFHQGP